MNFELKHEFFLSLAPYLDHEYHITSWSTTCMG